MKLMLYKNDSKTKIFGEKETEQAAELEDYSDSVKKRIDKLTYPHARS